MNQDSPAAALPGQSYEALRRAIALLAEAEPSAARAADKTREENAPVDGEVEGRDSLNGLMRTVELIRCTVQAAQAALARLDDEACDLTLVASFSGGISGPLLGPRRAYPRLRGLVSAGEAAVLAGEPEVALLAQALRAGRECVMEVVPVPTPRPASAEGAAWALLLFHKVPLEQPLEAAARRELLFTMAQLVGLALRGGLDETLRDRTRRVRIQHLRSERQPPALEHYREFFESTADGVILLDETGHVVWLNRAAEEMTGYAAVGLAEYPLAELVAEQQRPWLWYALGLIAADCPVPPFDLAFYTTSSEILVLSVSTSAVPTQPRYVVLSFRDVTEKRILENELRKTKEFLERLIDSTVDGIIAADITGQVVLFNQGAARITGYTPDEVIGKLPVWSLYPDDEARRVMAELRSEHSGGRGRLLQSRKAIIGKNGQLIPVALSASIIYEAEEEVATVGVLSDLRERLLIEERLLKTQERLAWSERQALLVELAGTAAHELNQPLTSVMGYAQLLQRQLPPSYSDIHEYTEVLMREAERMAEIVRKIGHITRYESKSYVGDTRILDLDKAVLPSPAGGEDGDAEDDGDRDRARASAPAESIDAGPLFGRGPGRGAG